MNYKGLLFCIIYSILLIGCREDEEIIHTPPVVVDSTLTADLSGYVQKGPFINGTAITVSELDKKLVTTGKNFTTQIADNKGAFSLKGIKLKSNFVQLQADGFYFDEVKGEKSAAQLTLFALSDVEDVSSINANLLSHMERTRVIYLMQEEGKSFGEAKQQAQQEILTVFGIEKEDMQHSEILDISQEGDDNAILLAISAILQANNSVAELSELVANIITDLREDGEMDSETNQKKIREQAMSLNLSQIRAHLEKRYADMGVETSIPDFEQYIDSDGDGILNKDEDDTPENFEFIAQKDVAINTKVTSNAVKISRLKAGGTADASVQNGRIVLNGKVVEDSVTQVKNGDQLQLQLTSSSDYADTIKTSVTIGTLVKNFQAITDDYIPEAFSFTAQKDLAVDSFYTSNTITVSGIPYETPLKIEDGIIIKNGEELESDTTSVKNGDQLAVKLLSSSEFEASTAALVDINGVSASFNITTDDYTPDPFSFTPIKDAKRDSVYTSNTITISGLPHPTPVGVAQFNTNNPEKGAIYVNGKKYSDNSFSLKNGDRIWIVVNSSEKFSTNITSSIIISKQEAFFKVITEVDPWLKIATLPSTKADAGFVIAGKLYIVAYDKKTFEYNPSTNQWIQKADFPGDSRTHMSSFSLLGKGYVGLGVRNFGSSWDTYTKFFDFWNYDPVTDSWSRIKDFAGEARYSATSFTLNDRAYVGLGTTTYAEFSEYGSFKDIWEYNPQNDSWTSKASYPGSTPIAGFGFAKSDHWHIAIGRTSEYWSYNTISNSWIRHADFPNVYPVRIPFLIGETLYVNGAPFTEETSEKKHPIYFYNLTTKDWQKYEYNHGPSVDYDRYRNFTIGNSAYFIQIESGDFWKFTPPQE